MAEGRTSGYGADGRGDHVRARKYSSSDDGLRDVFSMRKRQRSDSSYSSLNSPAPLPCCGCPVSDFGRILYRSSWTDKQVRALKFTSSGFPRVDFTKVPSSTVYPLHCANDVVGSIFKRSFMSILQWLFESVEFQTVDGTLFAGSTIPVSQDVIDVIEKELKESSFCKMAVAIQEEIELKRGNMTHGKMCDIIMAVSDIPDDVRIMVLQLFKTWFEVYESANLAERMLDDLLSQVVNYVYSGEYNKLINVGYKVRLDRQTMRCFEVCGQKCSSSCDVDVLTYQDERTFPPKEDDNDSLLKVIMISENKVGKYGMTTAFPQMACQFAAAAKDSPFHSKDHHIVYGVSACGVEGILLSRGHVCKKMAQRKDKCLREGPKFEGSHVFFSYLTFPIPYQRNDIYMLLSVYWAVKAVVLLDRENKKNKAC